MATDTLRERVAKLETSHEHLVTRGEFYRALWIQGGVIVTLNAAVVTAVAAITTVFGS